MKKAAQILMYLFVLAFSAAFIYYGSLYFSQSTHEDTVYDKENELDAMVFATIASIDNVVQREDLSGLEISFTAKTFGGSEEKLVHSTPCTGKMPHGWALTA